MPGPIPSFPFSTDLGATPKEGPKYISLSIGWQSVFDGIRQTAAQTVNLLSQFQTGQFTAVQAVWIDNQSVPYEVVLACEESGQEIRIPAFTAGMYPLIAGPAPIFTVSLNWYPDVIYGVISPWLFSTTDLFFLNTPQTFFQLPLPPYGQASGTYCMATTMAATPLDLTSFGFFGPGLVAQGGTNFFICGGLSITLMAVSGYSAGSPVNARIYEGGKTGPYTLWQDDCYAPAGSVLPFYQNSFEFSPPLMQRDTNNDFFLSLSHLPGTGGVYVALRMNVGIVAIK